MGPLTSLLGMIPGLAGHQLSKLKVDEREFDRIEAIILSMTPEERRRPEIIKGSRRQRIANGSGTTVQQVNQLVKQFGEMRKMMRGLSAGQDARPRAADAAAVTDRSPLSCRAAMAVAMRLTRVGGKKDPVWRVVVADRRSPRDGRFIETIGRYNAQTDPRRSCSTRSASALARARRAAVGHGPEAAQDPGHRLPARARARAARVPREGARRQARRRSRSRSSRRTTARSCSSSRWTRMTTDRSSGAADAPRRRSGRSSRPRRSGQPPRPRRHRRLSCCGRHVGRPHGLDGSFHVTRRPGAARRPRRAAASTARRVALVRRGRHRRQADPAARGLLGTREDAEALRGARSRAGRRGAAAGGGRVLGARPRGLRVVDGEREVGVVARMVALPVVRGARGRASRADPARPRRGPHVDLEAGRIDVDLGFLRWTLTSSRCSRSGSTGSGRSATWATRSRWGTRSSASTRGDDAAGGGAVDDTPFGGGAGMVLRVDVVELGAAGALRRRPGRAALARGA